MSLDTRDKRMSMIGIVKPNVRLFKNPAGVVDATARAMVLFLYSGIPFAPPAIFNTVWASTQANKTVGYRIEPR